jgi:hypothetical protein
VNTATSAKASQKLGAAYSAVVITVRTRSAGCPRRTACHMPIGTPIRNVSSNDAVPSAIETGSASRNAPETG